MTPRPDVLKVLFDRQIAMLGEDRRLAPEVREGRQRFMEWVRARAEAALVAQEREQQLLQHRKGGR